jgi:hypothetical protein
MYDFLLGFKSKVTGAFFVMLFTPLFQAGVFVDWMLKPPNEE